MLGIVAGKGVGVGDGRGGAVTCVVGGVWLTAARASPASGLQW